MGIIYSNLSLRKDQSDNNGEDTGNVHRGQEEKREGTTVYNDTVM